MKNNRLFEPSFFIIILVLFSLNSYSQLKLESGDPPQNKNIPDFYRSKLTDVENEIAALKIGSAKVLATSPGGLRLYGVLYGEKEDFQTQANYNSAVAARNTAYFAKKNYKTSYIFYWAGSWTGS